MSPASSGKTATLNTTAMSMKERLKLSFLKKISDSKNNSQLVSGTPSEVSLAKFVRDLELPFTSKVFKKFDKEVCSGKKPAFGYPFVIEQSLEGIDL